MVDIDLKRFSGMNNVNKSFYAGKKVASPKVVLNANVNPAGKIDIRAGMTLFLALPGSHSLWSCESCMLCAAAGKLYDIGGGVAVELDDIDGPATPTAGHIDYVLCEDKVYISNLYWQGVFDPSIGTVSTWGIPLPPGPMLITATGGLPAGTYHVVFTTLSGSEISGNGPISSITLAAEGGIEILNRPNDALVWATDENEHIFCLVGANDVIKTIPTVDPLPTFMCGPPPLMENLAYAFGILWGTRGNKVYYSEPYRPGLFRLMGRKFTFDSAPNLLAHVSTGMFVGMHEMTRFLKGTEPDQMAESKAGAGSIKGTLAYCNNVPYLADVLGTPEKTFVDVPIWRTHDGIVAGNAAGRLFNLTKDKLKMGRAEKGASLSHPLNGIFRFLTSSKVSGAGDTDTDTDNAFKNGSLPVSDIAARGLATTGGLSEEVSCELYRGGVLVPP